MLLADIAKACELTSADYRALVGHLEQLSPRVIALLEEAHASSHNLVDGATGAIAYRKRTRIGDILGAQQLGIRSCAAYSGAQSSSSAPG